MKNRPNTCIYAKKAVNLQPQIKINNQIRMKKYFLLAFVALSMSALAQHVTPLNIEIADPKIDSLRTLYLAEPPMYRAALNMVAQSLDQNAQEVKAAKEQLKVEQTHAKELGKSLVDATKMAAALKKLYAKEEGELKSMQKVVEKQQKTIAKQKELNKENRDTYIAFLEKQQKELGYSLREVADRERAIADLETSIQNHQTNLNSYASEIEQKAHAIAQLEALLKQRQTVLKAEQKAAKSMQ